MSDLVQCSRALHLFNPTKISHHSQHIGQRCWSSYTVAAHEAPWYKHPGEIVSYKLYSSVTVWKNDPLTFIWIQLLIFVLLALLVLDLAGHSLKIELSWDFWWSVLRLWCYSCVLGCSVNSVSVNYEAEHVWEGVVGFFIKSRKLFVGWRRVLILSLNSPASPLHEMKPRVRFLLLNLDQSRSE